MIHPARRTIVLTGYWPPTNEMLRRFSPNPARNPEGWIGADWQALGFDIHAFFPEFPGKTGPMWGRGEGDFPVEYAQTVADFQRVTAQLRPAAILTTSRTNDPNAWELEPAYQRWALLDGQVDSSGRRIAKYVPEFLPWGEDPERLQALARSGSGLPDLDTFLSEPLGRIRLSNLPMDKIVQAVKLLDRGRDDVNPYVARFDPNSEDRRDFAGNYLSGFVGYLGCWYRDRHAVSPLSQRCWLAGHVHVGIDLDLAVARRTFEATLRVVIEDLKTRMEQDAAR